MKLAANLSLMFTELPMIERLSAAKQAGFDWVEIQFPYECELDDLTRARKDADVDLVLINLPAGNIEAGDAGLTAVPGREDEYADGVGLALEYAQRLGVRKINSLAGKPKEPFRQNAFHTARHNLEFAAREFSKIDAMILVEPVSPVVVPGFYLSKLQSAIDLVCEIKADNVKVLFDFFHMQQTETSLTEAIARCGVLIGHVQFADTPERHEPGTGEVDFDAAFNMLRKVGYDGIVSAEYRPSLNTGDSLAWMERFEGWSGNAHR